MDKLKEFKDKEVTLLHADSEECLCKECQEKRNRYIQIMDVNRYVNSLNDWD